MQRTTHFWISDYKPVVFPKYNLRTCRIQSSKPIFSASGAHASANRIQAVTFIRLEVHNKDTTSFPEDSLHLA